MSSSDETKPIKATDIDMPSSDPLVRERRRHRHHSSGPRWWRKLKRKLSVKRVRWRTMLLYLVAIVAVVVVGALALTADAANRVQSSVNGLERVLGSLQSRPGTELTLNDFNRLQSSVKDVVQTLGGVQRQIALARPFAGMSTEVEATLVTLESAHELARAADVMLTGLQPTLFFLVSGSADETVAAQFSSGERVVELLRIGRSQFISAGDLLTSARQRMDALEFESLSPASVLRFRDLEGYQEMLAEINSLLLEAPDLLTSALGIDAERSYLILSQNSDELRPSGGYISTYGWLTIRSGRILDYSYSPTTATSPNPPGDDFAGQYEIPPWWIQYSQPVYAAWDGSWYADFPGTADMAMDYYNAGNNPQSPVHGVIGIDIVGFEYVLDALGSVVVPGYSTVVTPDNFRTIVYDIRAFGLGENPHKRFVADVYQQIFSDWQTVSMDPSRSAALLGAMLKGLQEKHIVLYFEQPELNRAVDVLGWSGAQAVVPSSDYLLVADANLGNKSNRSVLRQLTYDVEIQANGSLNSRVTVGYDYSDRVASADPAVDPEHHGQIDYSSLLQVMVPLGSELTGTNLTFQPETAANDHYSIFVSQNTVEYDTTDRLQFSYSTPPLVETFGAYSRYQLTIQKQLGTISDPASVQVTLPAGAQVVRVSPQPVASYNLDKPILEFRFTLNTDQSVEIIYSR